MIKSLACETLQKTLLKPLLGVKSCQPIRFRRPSPCYTNFQPRDKKPCFDIRNVTVDFGNQCHAKMIRSFLYNHHWPREPSVVGLWMSLECPYLKVITDKYANSGDRFVAYEHIPRTGERKMVGVTVGNKIYPWAADELEAWAHNTSPRPERHRMYFIAHCYRSPDLYNKYNVDYIYDMVDMSRGDHNSRVSSGGGCMHVLLQMASTCRDDRSRRCRDDHGSGGVGMHLLTVEILATSSEVTAQGVGTKLLQTILDHCYELRHPLVQVIAFSQYTARICEKCGMKREWSMNYAEFVDDAGQRVFFPRRPHHTVAIYVKYNDPKLGGLLPAKPITD